MITQLCCYYVSGTNLNSHCLIQWRKLLNHFGLILASKKKRNIRAESAIPVSTI